MGHCIGWTSSTVAVYIAECSPADLRGPLVALQSVLITLGRFSGAFVSALVFTAQPPVKRPVLAAMLTSKSSRVHQWIDALDFTGRRFFHSPSPLNFARHVVRFSCPVTVNLKRTAFRLFLFIIFIIFILFFHFVARPRSVH